MFWVIIPLDDYSRSRSGGEFSGDPRSDYGGGNISPGVELGSNLNWTFIKGRRYFMFTVHLNRSVAEIISRVVTGANADDISSCY